MPEVEHLDKLCIAKIYDQLAKEEENMCRDKGLYLVQIELSHFPLPVLFQEQTVVGTGGIGMDNPSLLSQGSLNSQDSRSLETLHDILQAGHTLGQRVIDSHAQLQGGHQVIYVSGHPTFNDHSSMVGGLMFPHTLILWRNGLVQVLFQ